jgi:hypothetical protein
MELLALCTVLSMLLPTGLICDLHWHRQSSTINRQRCCRQAARQSATSTCNVTSCSRETLAYGMHSRRKRMFERCRQHSNPHTRRRRAVELVSVSEELAMLGSHSQLADTVHDTTVPAAAVICNLLAQQHAHHACFGVVRSNRPCTVQPVHG